MFTGIIESLGTLSAIRPAGRGRQVVIDSDVALEGIKPGDSIAVNGACLTAVSLSGHRFQADVSPETLAKTTFGAVKVGDRVNLERALRFSDRIDGHLVSGHIDGMGIIQKLSPLDNAVIITIEVPWHRSRPVSSVIVASPSPTVRPSLTVLPRPISWPDWDGAR